MVYISNNDKYMSGIAVIFFQIFLMNGLFWSVGAELVDIYGRPKLTYKQ